MIRETKKEKNIMNSSNSNDQTNLAAASTPTTTIIPRFHHLAGGRGGSGGRGLGAGRGRGGGRGGPSLLLVREASRRSMVKSDSVSKLLVESDFAMKQEAPQCLAIPTDWKKENPTKIKTPPPCEILFDSSIEFSLFYDSDLDDSCCFDSSDDSVAGSTCPGDDDGSFNSTSSSTKDNSAASSAGQQQRQQRQEEKETQPQQPQQKQEERAESSPPETEERREAEEGEEPAVVDIVISDTELTRQIRAVQVNPSPSRVQGICRQWHKILCANQNQNKSNSFSTRLMHQGGMEALLDAMILQKDYPEVQEAICWVLGLLLTSKQQDQEEDTNDNNNACKEWFVECSGIQSILQAMKSYKQNPWVQEASCWALFGLTYNCSNKSTTVQARLQELGGVQAVLDAMQYHQGVAGVQEQGCAMIANLQQLLQSTTTTTSCSIITSSVLLAMQNHLQEPGVQEYGCKALGNLLLVITTTASDANEAESSLSETTTTTILRAIGTAMSTHPSNIDVLESSLHALCSFVEDTTSSSNCNHNHHQMIKGVLSSMELSPAAAAAAHNSESSRCSATAKGLSSCLEKLMIQHPQIRETGNKLLRTIQQQQDHHSTTTTTTTNDISSPPSSKTTKQQATNVIVAVRDGMTSPTEVTTTMLRDM